MAQSPCPWRRGLVQALFLVPGLASCESATIVEWAAAAAVRGQVLSAEDAGVAGVAVHLEAVRYRGGGGEDVVAAAQVTTGADGTFAAGMGEIGLPAGDAELRVAVLTPGTHDTLAIATDVVRFSRDAEPADTTVIVIRLPV